MKCILCSEHNVEAEHENSINHLKNKALREFAINRKHLTKNRCGLEIHCDATSKDSKCLNSVNARISISVKPNEPTCFNFFIVNELEKENVYLNFVHLPRNNLNFVLNDEKVLAVSNPQCIKPKEKMSRKMSVKFVSPNIGQYEMTIFFSFQINNENICITRDMVVYVEEIQVQHLKMISPYTKKSIVAKKTFYASKLSDNEDVFRIPKNYKIVYARAFELGKEMEKNENLTIIVNDLKRSLNTGATRENYVHYFHNLLWYEETIMRINLKNYNMSNVEIKLVHNQQNNILVYSLNVPGLAEKRPSLISGDTLLVKPVNNDEVIYEGIISQINENDVYIKYFHRTFQSVFDPKAKFDVRFNLSRTSLERMHHAVHNILSVQHHNKIFPIENKKIPKTVSIINYFNVLVERNKEQRLAVERIVAGSSGAAPYLLHGPPGTGKTVTIVEAVLQLVSKNPNNRILICTDSNMAADHVATILIKYAKLFRTNGFLLRANSKFRVWETLPACLHPYSNGKSLTTFVPTNVSDILKHRIIVTTLSHSAKFGKQFKFMNAGTPISHLFIDEAAQASEPACLIPTAGLVAPRGRLVLAGDPRQLGPVIISHDARRRGLGTSLMERLMKDYPMYSDERSDPNYVVMLRENFRSHADIIDIPNKLFYKNLLIPRCSTTDPITTTDILGISPTSRGIVFHGVLAREEKIGKSPSYFNVMEMEIVQKYVRALIEKHHVAQEDIGIITPYIRQMYKIKLWLTANSLTKVEVGTVEAFQGKEKRVVVVSTVRANCGLLDHDARFQLGFLVDDKRFNVAITRAKSKAIVIGNPLCLEKDVKWRMYMDRCRTLGTYHGFDPNTDGNRAQTLEEITPVLKTLVIH